MLPDMKSVWPVIVGRDLNRKPHAIANVRNKTVSGPPIAFPNLVRENNFSVGVDARPQPIIAALCLIVFRQSASMTADILPLFVHLDSDARQITKVFVH